METENVCEAGNLAYLSDRKRHTLLVHFNFIQDTWLENNYSYKQRTHEIKE